MRYDGKTTAEIRDRSEDEFQAFVANGGVIVIGRGRATEYAEELEGLVGAFGLRAVIHYAKGDECVVKVEQVREAEEAAAATAAPVPDVLERCMATMGRFNVEVEPLLEDSALLHVPAWQPIAMLAEIVIAANDIGRVRTYHEALTSIASRATEGGRITLVVEPDPQHD